MPWPEITARPTDRQLREFAAAGAALCCAMAVWQVVGGNWWPAGAWLLSAVVGRHGKANVQSAPMVGKQAH